jgi:hypothetical protein
VSDSIYRGMDRATPDSAYNNRKAVADYAAIAAGPLARGFSVALDDLAGPR